MEKKTQYNPKPIDDLNEVDLPRDLEGLWEALAENNHDIWAQKRFAEGWTYGEKRDDTLKQHPDLVPYCNLPEEEKTYDREMAQASLRATYKSGFFIEQRQKGRIMLIGRYNKSFIAKFERLAFAEGLDLVSFKKWEEAKDALAADITKWSAIIFDSESDGNDKNRRRFMRNVIDGLNALFHKTYNEIPWYICPFKEDEFTSLLIQLAVSDDRNLKDWGKVTFSVKETKELLKQIVTVIPGIRNYKMRAMYGDVFDTIDKYFINPAEKKRLLGNLLLPLLDPMEFHRFKPTDFATGLRKIFESILLVLIDYHIIPDVIQEAKGDRPEICSKKEHGEPNHGFCIKHLTKANTWGNGDIQKILTHAKDILDDQSHATIYEMEKNGLFHSITSYALQLADVIIWLGRFIEKTQKDIKNYEGEWYDVEYDGFSYHADNCILSNKNKAENAFKRNRQVMLKNVMINNHRNNVNYLYIADIDV